MIIDVFSGYSTLNNISDILNFDSFNLNFDLNSLKVFSPKTSFGGSKICIFYLFFQNEHRWYEDKRSTIRNKPRAPLPQNSQTIPRG